jgi:hypothetical protein
MDRVLQPFIQCCSGLISTDVIATTGWPARLTARSRMDHGLKVGAKKAPACAGALL